MSDNRHENYQILNLIGYGLARFSMAFVNQFGFTTKSAFYKYLIDLGVGEKESTFKMRQDLLDPFFDNGRTGFASRGNTYKHRKDFIELLFGKDIDVKSFADIVKLSLENDFQIPDLMPTKASPIIKSKFRQLQKTGKEAESYFMENYHFEEPFKNGSLEDARLYGDGYDFQIQTESKYFLVEVKGVRINSGGFRMTEKEFHRAKEYRNDYGLVIVSNLENLPKMNTFFNPTEIFNLEKSVEPRTEIFYFLKSARW
ncbi:DUF3883 domain-containing protein [soil metagenome]